MGKSRAGNVNAKRGNRPTRGLTNTPLATNWLRPKGKAPLFAKNLTKVRGWNAFEGLANGLARGHHGVTAPGPVSGTTLPLS